MSVISSDFKFYEKLYLYKDKPKKGKCRASLIYHDNENKRRQVSQVFDGKTIKEVAPLAIEWAKELDAAAELQGNITSKKVTELKPTVQEIVQGYLDRQLNTGKIERSTHSEHTYLANKRIYPYIGSYGFVDLDLIAINKWLTELAGEGLSQSYIRTIYNILRKVYAYYYKTEQIPRNPCEFVDPPAKGKPKVTHLTPAQLNELLVCMELEYPTGDPMRCVITLAAYAGLRRGEICGLRWREVDFESNVINITSSIGNAKQGCYTKAPKNRTSYRSFPMLPQVRLELEQRYNYLQETIGEVSGAWFVCGEYDQFLIPSTLNRDFKKFVVKYDLVDNYGKLVTPHSLRHNFASVGIRSHMDISSLSLIMGHASRAMTLDTYGDANADAVLAASKKLGETFTKELDAEN